MNSNSRCCFLLSLKKIGKNCFLKQSSLFQRLSIFLNLRIWLGTWNLVIFVETSDAMDVLSPSTANSQLMIFS